MALDPSIIGGIRPIQIDSPVNALAQVLRVQGMQQEAQMGQAKLDEYQRAKTRQNKLLELVQRLPADTTDEQRISALKGGGYFDEADKLETGMLNRQKTGAEVKAKEWEAQSKKLDLAGQAFGYVRQNPTLEAAHQVLDYLGQNGVYSPETVAQYKQAVAADPTKIASLADTAFRTVLGAKEQLMKVDTRNLGSSTQTLGIDPVTGKTTVLSAAANSMTPGEAARVGVERERLAWDKSQPKGQVVQTDAGPLLVDPRTGQARPVTGADGQPVKSTKAPTEFQGKSAAFGARAEQADKILVGLEGKYSPAAINSKGAVENTWLVGGALGAATNKFALSDADQQAEQAQRDFINAVLRQESGAAIGAGEFDNAKKQYFPQPGDSAGVIQQKAANRKLAIQGLQSNAGRAAFSAPAAPAAATSQKTGLPSGWSVEVH